MESWRTVWRNGFLAAWRKQGGDSLLLDMLRPLAEAVESDDPRLIQGSTTDPPPLMTVYGWPVEAADAVAFCGWRGVGIERVGDVEEFFANSLLIADQFLGESGSCRWFLNWFDDTPRPEMRLELLAELRYNIAVAEGRGCPDPATDPGRPELATPPAPAGCPF